MRRMSATCLPSLSGGKARDGAGAVKKASWGQAACWVDAVQPQIMEAIVMETHVPATDTCCSLPHAREGSLRKTGLTGPSTVQVGPHVSVL